MTTSVPSAPRAGARKQGLLYLAVAVLLWLVQKQLAASLASQLPRIGLPLFLLAIRACSALFLIAALWRLRKIFVQALSRAANFLDRIETRLFSGLSPRRARWSRALLVGLTVSTSANMIVEMTRFEQGLEARFVDRWFSMRFPQRSQAELATDHSTRQHALDEVVVVALDDDSIARLGWPLPRHVYARLIQVLSDAHPASVSFDISLIDPSLEHPEWDAAIGSAAAHAGNVFFTYTLSPLSREGLSRPTETALKILSQNSTQTSPLALQLPEFSEFIGRPVAPRMVIDVVATQAHGVAMANVVPDGDDILRHSLLVSRVGQQLFPSLSLRIAADALHVPLDQIRVYPGSHIDVGNKRRVPVDELARTLVRYQGRHGELGGGPVQYIPFWSLLRADMALTLQGSPMGEDQEFLVEDTAIDLSRLKPGAALSGIALYASDPGRVASLTLPAEVDLGDSKFEVLDENRMRFTTRIGTLRKLGVSATHLSGKHVLVGSTALATFDLHNTPVGAIPGVEHHATMLANLLRGDFFRTAPLVARLLSTFALGLFSALCGGLLAPGLGFVLAALLVFALVLGTFLFFTAGVHVPVVAPLFALLFSYGLCVLLGFRAEARARAQAEAGRELVRRIFGRYLTDQVVQEILDSPDGLKLGGQRRYITVMLTDLRGFTSMCGAMEPEGVVTLINHYLAVMTRIITRYGGTIDEFIGDAILVAFGAPLKHEDDTQRAVACALEMQNAMAEVNRWNAEHGLPEVEMGIGLHSGDVVIGNIGSEMRAKYGMMGTTINLTSRVESFTVGGQVLISEATRERCGALLTLGGSQTVTAKGIKGALTVSEVLAIGAPYSIELTRRREEMVPLKDPLVVYYAIIKDKQVGELSHQARIEALSESGLELHTTELLEEYSNLLLRVVDEGGTLRPGDVYAKVLKSKLRPEVAYLRLTSVPPEIKPILDRARSGA